MSDPKDWLRPVDLTGEGTRTTAILAAAAKMADTARGRTVVELTDLACGRPPTGAGAGDTLRDFVAAEDSSYSPQTGDLVEALAACVTLARVLEYEDLDSAHVACLLEGAAWTGLLPVAPELLDRARESLERTRPDRQSSTLPPPEAARSPEDQSPIESLAASQPGTAASLAQLAEVSASGRAAQAATAEWQVKHTNAVQERLRSQETLTGIALWAMRRQSVTAGVSWSKVSPHGLAGLILGVELSGLANNRLLPCDVLGLIPGLLERQRPALAPLRKVVDGAGSLPVLPEVQPSRLWPLTTCLALKREVSSGWTAAAADLGIDVDATHTAVSYAEEIIAELVGIARLQGTP